MEVVEVWERCIVCGEKKKTCEDGICEDCYCEYEVNKQIFRDGLTMGE